MATTTRTSGEALDIPAINLTRLLSRLEHNILAEPSSQLRTSSLERARVSANIEHARTLLLNLEHSASTLPSKSKKDTLQKDLQQKREVIKQLNQRILELNQLDDESSVGSGASDSEDDEPLPSYAPKVKVDGGRDITVSDGQGNEALQNAAHGLASQLRRRGGQEEDVKGAQSASGNSLFPSKSKTTTGDATRVDAEAMQSRDRREQEDLSASLLDMAAQLKQQSRQFAGMLDLDKGMLDRALSGLDQSTTGMDAATQRMGTLRRMTEGRGFWDRLRLWGMIAALWVAAFLIVFAGPKIRF